MARRRARARLRDGPRRALPRRRCCVRDRLLPGRTRERLSALRRLATGCRALALVDAEDARYAERLQRVARLQCRRVGARARLRARVAELRAVRRAARARGGAQRGAARGAARAALAQGPLPARQSPRVQPEVLPELAAPLRCVRAAPRSAARRDRRARGGVVPAARRPARVSLAAGLALALASTGALNVG